MKRWFERLFIPGLIALTILLYGTYFWVDANQHQGCRKIEGWINGQYGYVWDCPAKGTSK